MTHTITETLLARWRERSGRERLMLVIMGVAVAAFLLWFAVAAPLISWRRAAIERYAEAASAATIVRPAVGPGSQLSETEATLDDALTLAADAGLSARLIEGDGQGTGVEIDSATANALFSWLAAMEDSGSSIQHLSVLENADATLQATVVWTLGQRRAAEVGRGTQ